MPVFFIFYFLHVFFLFFVYFFSPPFHSSTFFHICRTFLCRWLRLPPFQNHLRTKTPRPRALAVPALGGHAAPCPCSLRPVRLCLTSWSSSAVRRRTAAAQRYSGFLHQHPKLVFFFSTSHSATENKNHRRIFFAWDYLPNLSAIQYCCSLITN